MSAQAINKGERMKLSRIEKTILYVISAINELVDKGFLTKDVMYEYTTITNKRKTKRQLKNFVPTVQELDGALIELIDLDSASDEVRKIFGELASQEFVSVQPMNLPSGLIFYLDFKYGTAQAAFGVGEQVFGVTSGSSDPTGGLYGAGKFGYSVNDSTSTKILAANISSASVSSDIIGRLIFLFRFFITASLVESFNIISLNIFLKIFTRLFTFAPLVLILSQRSLSLFL